MSFVLLMSAKGDSASGRSHYQFDTKDELAQNLIDLYEDFLETAQGATDSDDLNYTSEDLFAYMDSTFDELVCLERQLDLVAESLWIPNTCTWIKEVIYEHLRNVSGVDHEQQQVVEQQRQHPPPVTHNHQSVSLGHSSKESLELHNYEPPMEVDGMNDVLIY